MKIAFLIISLLWGISAAFATGFVIFENTFEYPITISWSAWLVFFFLIGSIIWVFDENYKFRYIFPLDIGNTRSFYLDLNKTDITKFAKKDQIKIIFFCLKQDKEFELFLDPATATESKEKEIKQKELYNKYMILKELTAIGLVEILHEPAPTLIHEPAPKHIQKDNAYTTREFNSGFRGHYRFGITGDGLITNNIYWYRSKKGMISFWQVWGGYLGYFVALLSLLAVIESN